MGPFRRAPSLLPVLSTGLETKLSPPTPFVLRLSFAATFRIMVRAIVLVDFVFIRVFLSLLLSYPTLTKLVGNASPPLFLVILFAFNV